MFRCYHSYTLHYLWCALECWDACMAGPECLLNPAPVSLPPCCWVRQVGVPTPLPQHLSQCGVPTLEKHKNNKNKKKIKKMKKYCSVCLPPLVYTSVFLLRARGLLPCLISRDPFDPAPYVTYIRAINLG